MPTIGDFFMKVLSLQSKIFLKIRHAVMGETTKVVSFMYLMLDIPEKPQFKNEGGGLVISQVPLVSALKKFDGVVFSDCKNKSNKGVSIICKFFILDLARFKKHDFYVKKSNHYSISKILT